MAPCLDIEEQHGGIRLHDASLGANLQVDITGELSYTKKKESSPARRAMPGLPESIGKETRRIIKPVSG